MIKAIKGISFLLILSLLIILVPFQAESSSEPQDKIKIGAILPIGGLLSHYGTQIINGIQMAADELNAKGGINGKTIELIVEDDGANPEKALKAFSKLSKTDKVCGVIGSFTSKCSLAIGEAAQSAKITTITPTSTSDYVTGGGNYIFRACYEDSFQGNLVAKFAYKDLKARKAAVLYNATNDYSMLLRTTFIKKFKALGGAVVAEQRYFTGDRDFSAQLDSIKGEKPDVLFIPDYYSTIPVIATQAENIGIKAILLGANGWDKVTGNAGDEMAGSYYCNQFSSASDDPVVKDFIGRYRSIFNEAPNTLSVLGYDAACILFEAIQRAGSTDSEKICTEMMKTDRKFVTGNIRFDSKGNAIKPGVMLKIRESDGRLEPVYAGTIRP